MTRQAAELARLRAIEDRLWHIAKHAYWRRTRIRALRILGVDANTLRGDRSR